MWVPGGRTLWIYDPAGAYAEMIVQEPVDTLWVNAFRIITYFDEQGRRTEALSQEWSGGVWVNVIRQAWSYNGTDVSGWLSYAWDGASWTLSSRGIVVHIYDSNGHRQFTTVDRWQDGDWSLHSESFLSHHADGRFDQEYHRLWEVTGWQNQIRFARTYDTLLRPATFLMQDGKGTEWLNVSLSVTDYASGTGSDDSPDADAAALSVSPNPVADRATVHLVLRESAEISLDVFDMLGRVVGRLHTGPLTGGLSQIVFSTRGLPPGAYLVRATDGRWLGNRRFVVR
jgi:hypothetical protein